MSLIFDFLLVSFIYLKKLILISYSTYIAPTLDEISIFA